MCEIKIEVTVAYLNFWRFVITTMDSEIAIAPSSPMKLL